LDAFDKSLPMMLYRTLDTIIPRYRAVFKKHDISEQQWRILRVLWENEKCTTAELASKALLPSPSLVGIIDRMTSKGLVARDRSEEDRRVVRIGLTAKGRSLEAELKPQIDRVYEEMVSQCDGADWRMMMATLQTIIDTN